LGLIKLISIPFFKYTHCGNSFVIVDELSQPYLPEPEKLLFAKQASDVNFGIGSDNLLVIQPAQSDVLRDINLTFRYWDILPSSQDCDYIFRFFDKKEALACGNGLLCISGYLYENYGIENARIMIEVPQPRPSVIKIGFDSELKMHWCNLGYPRQVPENIIPSSGIERYKKSVDLVYGLKISFRSNDLGSFAEDTPLLLSGYLTFTGEPHLVFFPDECFPPELANAIFTSVEENQKERRVNFGSWLVKHIGAYINRYYQSRFPEGVNVNFARVLANTNIIQYRTYERGNDYETLACGTGAVAISHIAQVLRLVADDIEVTLVPYLCNLYKQDSKFQVVTTHEGTVLYGDPSFLFEGRYAYWGAQKVLNYG
jgi:diaminopimelate epimerase